MYDYHNRKIRVGDLVNLDNKIGNAWARVIGFTNQKVKVRYFYMDQILNIYPQNLTIIGVNVKKKKPLPMGGIRLV
jgi:hypothetical protein